MSLGMRFVSSHFYLVNIVSNTLQEMAQMLSDIEKAWKLHEEQSIQEKQANPPPITAS